MHRAHRLVAQALWRIQPRAIIFRTTVMGHKDCERFETPFETLSREQRLELASLYNWANFSALNEHIIAAFREIWPSSRFFVLDVSPFELRGDGHADPRGAWRGHVDCLHYCVPSAATEWWSRLLVHVLVSSRSLRGGIA